MAKRELIFKEDGQGESSCHLAVRQVVVRRSEDISMQGEARFIQYKARRGSSYARRGREVVVMRDEGGGSSFTKRGGFFARLARGKGSTVLRWWSVFGCDDEIWIMDMETESGIDDDG